MFLDDVQRWLLQPEPAQSFPPLPKDFDLEGRWAVVWHTLEVLEEEDEVSWRDAHEMWTRPGHLEAWLAILLPRFMTAFATRLRKKGELLALLDLALAGEIRVENLKSARFSSTTLRHAQRIAEHATDAVPSGIEHSLQDWSRQNALVTADDRPTALGRVLVQLRGRDAVELALAIGVELSVGPIDPWRLTGAALQELLEGPMAFDQDLPLERQSRFERIAVLRLHEMGIVGHLREYDDPYFDRFVLNEDARDLVARVATAPDSRYRALVRALLDAERGRVATATGRVPDSSDLHYARSVAHEIRNLTLPMSTALTALWEELGRDLPDHERRQKLRDRIDRSMARLQDFANEAVKLSAVISDEKLALASVVAEAVSNTEIERNGRITVYADSLVERHVTGGRRDWVSAFANLFRNAAQVRAGQGQVWVSTSIADSGALHVYVDDDGPGVPEERRERVFDLGQSTLGGSGIGLAEARKTAEAAGGTLTCEASPQGGARLHFTLPPRGRP